MVFLDARSPPACVSRCPACGDIAGFFAFRDEVKCVRDTRLREEDGLDDGGTDVC